jgi:hypothetical protein
MADCTRCGKVLNPLDPNFIDQEQNKICPECFWKLNNPMNQKEMDELFANMKFEVTGVKHENPPKDVYKDPFYPKGEN